MRLLFLSHSGDDKAYAKTLSEKLTEWGYESVFVYWDRQSGIAGGTDWTRELYQKLRLTSALVAVYSPAYFASKWCFAELTAARLFGKPVIPIRVDVATGMPADLQTIQTIDYREDAASGFSRLERALKLAGLSASDDFAPDPSRPPYPGLAPLEEQDAAVFFGRQPEISAALEAFQRIGILGQGGLFLIAGASGSGKSSLLRAGLLPRLGKAQPGRWLVLPPLQPRQGFSLLADLRAAVGCQCSSREEVLARLQETSRERGVPGATVVLAIDQFEQLFAEHPPPDSAEALTVLAALAARPSPIVIIAVIRSDYLDRFQTHERLRDLEYEFFSLGLMPASRFVDVVQGPADVYGLVFDPPSLPGRMAGEAGTDEALPLLAFALRALWEPARREGVIRESLYESLFGAERGGISGAVARTADHIVGGLEPGVREGVRRAFVQLVRFDLNEKPVRRQARWSVLPAAASNALARLVDARLLTSRGDGPDRFIDVAHESLFRVWPTLASWIRDDRAFHIWNRNLQEPVQLWRRDQANTLKGKALVESEQWLEKRGEDLAPEMRQFIAASVAERTREARRKKAWLSVAVAGAAVAIAAVIYSMYAEINRQRESALGSLVARARAARGTAVDGEAFEPDLLNRSLLLAVEAVRTKSQPDTLEALEEGLAWTHSAVVSTPSTSNGMLAFSDGGRYLARVGETSVEIIENEGKTLFEIPASLSENSLVLWAPQAPILVVRTDAELQVWEATLHRELWRIALSNDSDADCGFRHMQTALDAHGRYVAAVDGSVLKTWDLRSGAEAFSMTEPEPLCNVALGPDARYLALTNLGRDKAWLLDRAAARRLTIPLSSGNGAAFGLASSRPSSSGFLSGP